MAEPKITVSLTHDQWQWVMSLVLNSAYVRARPIVDAVEAAVRQHGVDSNIAAQRERSERENLAGLLSMREQDLSAAQYELRKQNILVESLRRQVAGYQGQITKRRRRAKKPDGQQPVEGTDG